MADLGNPLEIERRDQALGRAFDSADEMNAARSFRREREIVIVEAMEHWGGAFVRAIAHAARCADQHNYERLSNEFRDLWDKYAAEHARRVGRKYD